MLVPWAKVNQRNNVNCGENGTLIWRHVCSVLFIITSQSNLLVKLLAVNLYLLSGFGLFPGHLWQVKICFFLLFQSNFFLSFKDIRDMPMRLLTFSILFDYKSNRIEWVSEWVSEWLLFNVNSAIFQLYHGENNLIFNEMMVRSALY